MKAQAGVARRSLTPYWGVELTGWGYYIERTWRDVRDPLYVTALVIDNGAERVAILSLDLMVISAEFTAAVRAEVHRHTGIPATSILVCCTHSHNAPSSGGLLGAGVVDPFYEEWAARQSAAAAIEAWQARQPAKFSVATTRVENLTFNRTREGGPVDTTLTVLRVDGDDGDDGRPLRELSSHSPRDSEPNAPVPLRSPIKPPGGPLAVIIGYQGHPTVATVLQPFSVSRDTPGEICDRIEEALPGCLALYVQGACGDVNFLRSFSTPAEYREPGRRLAEAALSAMQEADELDPSVLSATTHTVRLPTRRWRQAEIDADRTEAEQRLRDRDLDGWREAIGRVMTNRPDDMVARHGGDEWRAVAAMCRFNLEWTEQVLPDLTTRPEWLETELQAIRLGTFGLVANASEFFTTLALDIRQAVDLPHLMFACYANGRIGYLPDAHDVERKTYAAYQSPKYCNQFPFTEESGVIAARAMADLLNGLGQ